MVKTPCFQCKGCKFYLILLVGRIKIPHASLYNPPQKIIIMQEYFLRQCLTHTSTSRLVAAVIIATIITAIMVMMMMMIFFF